ncbi:MAG: DUF2817 domain-containing protein [Alphaproteobacteria bacterium]|nr:DUF2817 domain-containing protein [Alphaproteobacteria bacterium]
MDVLSSLARSFADDYPEARSKFLDAVAAVGAAAAPWGNPNPGPRGEPVATDVAWIGPADARRVLVLIAATHGVEGFCGSGVQVDWLRDGGPERLPPDTAALLVHGLNCHGFAWWRRVTEEGCDLNRNFVDFSKPLPENPGHDALADAFVPASLEPDVLAIAEARIAAWRAEHGDAAFHAARKAGQYKHPHSMFFGGAAPSWARNTLAAIVEHHDLAGRALVSVIDVHTGLGPFGYGEPICGHKRGTVGLDRVLAMYGESTGLPSEGASFSIPLSGTQREFWQPRLGDAYTYVALEFGTFSQDNSRKTLRADHWLHNQGPVDWDDPRSRAIKDAIKHHYYPATDAWKEMVLWRSRQVIRQTLNGLETFV